MTLLDDRLLDLFGALCNGNISAEEERLLAERLLDDPAARRLYVQYMDLHLALTDLDVVGGGDSDSLLLGGFADSDGDIEESIGAPRAAGAIIPISAVPSGAWHNTVSYFSQVGPISYLTAVAITGVMLLAGWAYQISHYRQFAVLSPPAERSAEMPNVKFVGRISGMKDCRWADPNTATFLGAAVSVDRKYVLSSGLMEIAYTNGARVILEGPCAYTVDSDAGGYLALGKLTALVEKRGRVGDGETGRKPRSPLLPSSPSPRLFTVRTPTAVVTDLGTEFGVEVGENGATESHVIQGKVDVTILGAADGGNSHAGLVEGKAIRVEPNGKKFVVVAYAADRFIRRLTPPADLRADEAYIKAVLADKPLAYWPLNEPPFARKFVDRSGNNFHGAALGTVIPGRNGPLAGQSRAVELGGEGYIDVGRQPRFALSNGFTVEAWVWIDTPTGHSGRIISAATCEGYHQLSGWAMGYCGMTDPKTQGEEPYCTFTRYGEPGTVYHREKMSLRRWLHIVYAFAADNSLRIYLDGELWGEYPPGEPAATGSTWVAIGWGGNGGGEYWHGRLAHVAVYPAELSRQQIVNHFRLAEKPAEK